MYDTVVGKNIKRIIKERELKQKYIAEKCGYSPNKFSNMVNGYVSIKDVDIIKIKKVLNVDYNDLFQNF